MKRGAAVVVVVVLLAIGTWLLLSRESRQPESASNAAPDRDAPGSPAIPLAAAPGTAGESPAPRAPAALPTPDPAQLALSKEFLAQRGEMLRQFEAALRFGDPFPFVPVLELMAEHGDSRGARGLYEILRDCTDPERQSADVLAAEHVDRAARQIESGPMLSRPTPDIESAIAGMVAHAQAMDVGCAKVTRADADAAWLRLVGLAQGGNRAARYSVALEVALRYDSMVANGRLELGSELERASAAWLLDAALRGRTSQRFMLERSYCRGGLVPADPVQCYAWQQFGLGLSRFPARRESLDRLRQLRDALTPAQRALADKRIAELRACCSRPRY